MKKLNGIVWGIVLVAAGVLLGLNAFGITDIDIFFDGWWTLFIIVPCAVGLVTDRNKFGSLIGICVGVFLLLCCLIFSFPSHQTLHVTAGPGHHHSYAVCPASQII